jgi:hypothetical protein
LARIFEAIETPRVSSQSTNEALTNGNRIVAGIHNESMVCDISRAIRVIANSNS